MHTFKIKASISLRSPRRLAFKLSSSSLSRGCLFNRWGRTTTTAVAWESSLWGSHELHNPYDDNTIIICCFLSCLSKRKLRNYSSALENGFSRQICKACNLHAIPWLRMTHKENKLLIRKYANAIWTCMSLQINKQSVFLNMQFWLFMRTITPSFFIGKSFD